MKIYTKTGDLGETSLFTGDRVLKSNDLVEIFGQLDQLNSLVGLLTNKLSSDSKGLKGDLHKIQESLFSLGSYFASNFSLKEYLSSLDPEHLEKKMDEMDSSLKPLKNFILPGGTESSCIAHLCRTSTRSVERKVVSLDKRDATHEAIVFLNRLSDYFFVLARYCNHLENHAEPVWNPSK